MAFFPHGNGFSKRSACLPDGAHAVLLLVYLLAGFLAFPSYGQDDGVMTTNPAVDSAVPPSAEASDSYLTDGWFGLRSGVADRGVDFRFYYYAEGWANTAGGVTPGAVYTGLYLLESQIDFEKLVGWEGASFGCTWLWLSGHDPSLDLIGNSFEISNIAGFQTFRLFDMWFQQTLFDDLLSICIGQLAADTDFVISQYGTLFINGTFGWPAFLFMNLPEGGPAYAAGVPGVRVEVNPTRWMSYRGGLYQGSPLPQDLNRHGFMYRLNTNIGYFSIHETAFYVNQAEGDELLPGTYKFGGWFHSGLFENESNPNEMLPWNYGFYFIADQMLFHKPKSIHRKPETVVNPAIDSGAESLAEHSPHISDEGLGMFLRVGWQPQQNRNLMDFYFDSGLSYRGLLPGRSKDILGIGVAYGQLRSGVATVAGANQSQVTGYEMAIEATYQCQVTPWFIIQPDIQYIIHPAGNAHGNSLVLGIRSVISF